MNINNILKHLILCWLLMFSLDAALADEVCLKDGSQLKGLIVDNFYDRIVLSIPDGRLSIKKEKIKEIFFDDSEQNFLYLAQSNFKKGRLKQARQFLSKTLAINPDCEEALDFMDLIKNYKFSQNYSKRTIENKLKEETGLFIKRDEKNRVMIEKILKDSPADKAGLHKEDILYSLYSQRIKYAPLVYIEKLLVGTGEGILKLDIRRKIKILVPERRWYDIILRKKKVGFVVTSTEEGLTIGNLQKDSPAYGAGMEEGDCITSIDGEDTRFMSLTEARKKIKIKSDKELKLEIQRSLFIKRKGNE